MILLDTNILARVTNSGDPQCAVCRRAIDLLRGRNERLVIVPQNLYEFWAIATRPAGAAPLGQNGLGMKIEQARLWTQFFIRRFPVLPDRPELMTDWLTMVAAHQISGFRAHDVRLVAAMKNYGIQKILTINARDLVNLGVNVIDPATL